MPTKYIMVKTFYHDGTINKVDDSTKKSVKKSLRTAMDKIEPSFFNNLTLHVASDFSNLDSHNTCSRFLKKNEGDFSHAKGIASFDDLQREIYIQESAFKFNKLLNVFSSQPFRADEKIECATMHELGHQFDGYYGTDNKLKQEIYALRKKYKYSFEEVNSTKEDDKLFNYYLNNNGYSDKNDFKTAVLNDLQKINPKKLDLDDGYFVGEFFNRGLDIKPNKDDVQKADYTRGEVFAQLFAYAMGTDDGKKDKFLELFPNTYKVVKNYIEQHSKK